MQHPPSVLSASSKRRTCGDCVLMDLLSAETVCVLGYVTLLHSIVPLTWWWRVTGTTQLKPIYSLQQAFHSLNSGTLLWYQWDNIPRWSKEWEKVDFVAVGGRNRRGIWVKVGDISPQTVLRLLRPCYHWCLAGICPRGEACVCFVPKAGVNRTSSCLSCWGRGTRPFLLLHLVQRVTSWCRHCPPWACTWVQGGASSLSISGVATVNNTK